MAAAGNTGCQVIGGIRVYRLFRAPAAVRFHWHRLPVMVRLCLIDSIRAVVNATFGD